MVEQSTVLILGAGTSSPYRFPLGVQLRNLVCTPRHNDPNISSRIGPDPQIYNEFIDTLKKSGYGSVDAFLEAFPKFIDVGKRAIAWELSSFEQESFLFPPASPTPSWYEFLANQLLSHGVEGFNKNQITIITFNYDRSLEHFLATVLLTRTGSTYDQAIEHLGAISIYHVHGSLGELVNNAAFRPYRPDKSEQSITIAARSIQIVHEAEPNSPIFTAARQTIRAARRIYFLGFGYHPQNMQRLGFSENSAPPCEGDCEIYLGAFGYTPTSHERLRHKYNLNQKFLAHWNHSVAESVSDLLWN